ncbi:MLX-interacting protein isoform X2 [Homalodisca vitripennis]|uniref:MLX-interacting protein isoform X2 n=1 Tax=Homalodisca vitripennis TaxID=197043 RepID=UPI001EECAB52|nr:MLX-interacting protein isoform X2 [Homalodisca vitripennis]
MQCSDFGLKQRHIMTIMAQNMGLIEASDRLLSKIPPEKEIIHSGHFMVSNIEEEEEDVYESNSEFAKQKNSSGGVILNPSSENSLSGSTINWVQRTKTNVQHISIETSLTKLFQCMSLAYRQKLTSPKWNRFKGIRLRWKDKIRLNNVIWRCWHMQFITKKNSLVCQFASPLDTDTHNKPEAIVLEGKYWKRKLHAVTAEYKKWRLFYRNRLLGWGHKDEQDPHDVLSDLEMLEWQSPGDDCHMMVDEDYMEFMTDTLFSTITANQPFAFPDTREIARGANLADFIQPSLVQLQPNLDDFMDTLEPLQEFFNNKLPPVPEETLTAENLYRSLGGPSYLSEPKREMSSSYQTPSPPAPPPTSYYQYQPPPKSHQPAPPPPSYPMYNIPTQYQQLSPPPPPQRTSPSPPRQEYVLPHPPPPAPTPAITYPHVPMRSKSLPLAGNPPQRREEELFAMPKVKAFNRSRSGSCLSSTVKHPPPLVSANSDPQLSVPSQSSHPHHSSALLAKLLTSTSTVTQTYNNQGAIYSGPESLKMPGSSPSLSSPYYKPTDRHMEKSTHRSVIYSTQTDNGSLNLSSNRPDNRIAPIYETFTFTATPGSAGRKGKSSVAMLPHPSTSGMMLQQMSPNTSQVISSASNSPKHPDSPGTNDCLSLSPLNVNVGSPQSPSGTEHRRVSHINAEQKRRCNIKNGFDMLHSLIPQLSQNPNAKLSKAAMLQKGAEYIRQLRNERMALKDEIDSLRLQVDSLNSAISNCQALLPATGAPISRHRNNKMKEMFDEYVRIRTQENWKFWLLSLLCEPLLASFNAQVSTQSLEEMYRTTLGWVEQHCTLSVLRPLMSNALRHLCTTTDMLTDPSRLPAEARAAVSKPSGRPPSS